MKIRDITVTQTRPSMVIQNETTGTIYVKVPIVFEGINFFIVIPNLTLEDSNSLCRIINLKLGRV